MKTVIGIDASTTATGVSVFELEDKTFKYIAHDLFNSPEHKFTKKNKNISKTAYKALHSREKREFMEANVLFMMKEIGDILDKYEPDIIVMEDTYGQNDMMTLKMLSRIQGAVIDYGRRFNTEIIFKAPASWRKSVGIQQVEDGVRIKRKKLKELSKTLVKQKFDLDVTDDEADAICIGLSYKGE